MLELPEILESFVDISMQQNNVSLYNFDEKFYRGGICTKWVEIYFIVAYILSF